MTCEETARLLSESRDRRLPLSQRLGLKMHLAMCGLCRIVKGQWEFLGKLARAAGDTSEGAVLSRSATVEGLSLEAKARIKQRLSS